LVVIGPGSRSLRSLVRDDEIDSIFQTANFEAVIASVSEAIHRAAQRKNGLLRRFAPRNDD
jgi:hypothetical protein